MKHKVLLYLLLFLLTQGCKQNQRIDTEFVDQNLHLTDSLNTLLTQKYDETIKGIYLLTEDSILADSISDLVILPDTFQFYEFLQFNLTKLEDNYYQTQQEIYFTRDQLNGLKEDVEEKQISSIQYELELESQKAMVKLLVKLVDSNISNMIQVQSELHLITDSIPHE